MPSDEDPISEATEHSEPWVQGREQPEAPGVHVTISLEQNSVIVILSSTAMDRKLVLYHTELTWK